LKVNDDAASVHSSHPIIAAKKNPFGIDTDEDTDEDPDAAPKGAPHQAQHSGLASHVDRRESLPQFMPISREWSFGEFVLDVFVYEKESGEKHPACARLDTGMSLNAVSYSVARLLSYPIEDYLGEPCLVADGSEYHPIGQVTIPFKFANVLTARTWRLDFIVFPEGSPFDICLGRQFIKHANLLKPNPEALPVHFRDLKPGK
jgi:hypothetical protein